MSAAMRDDARDAIQIACASILLAGLVILAGLGLRAAIGAEAEPKATLVITMSTDHGEFERQDETDSLTECWHQAHETMEHMRAAKAHDGLIVTSIGVGCVVNIAQGDPA